jgi:6-phosphofructokinase 1
VGSGTEIRTLNVTDPLGNSLQFSDDSLFDTLRLLPSLSNLPTTTTNVVTEAPISNEPFSNSAPRKIAFLTSGGDCSGMNASIRSIVRYALAKNCVPFAVYEGYQGKNTVYLSVLHFRMTHCTYLGLVDGGNKIVKFGWDNVAGILHIVGFSFEII